MDMSHKNNNLIHDAFMYSSNIFSGNGFGSNPRAYAAVAQMNIISNLLVEVYKCVIIKPVIVYVLVNKIEQR